MPRPPRFSRLALSRSKRSGCTRSSGRFRPFWWVERASEHRGVTFQIGNKVHTGRNYDYECERVRDFLREAGFKTLLRKRNDEKGTASALFVTLDPKIGEEATALHPQYLAVLLENGANVPDWART